MSELLPKEWEDLERGAATSLEHELIREVCATHVLFQKQCTALAKRIGRDDVLFSVVGAKYPYYSVHLTYSFEKNPTFPFTVAFTSICDFIENWDSDDDDPSDDWRYFPRRALMFDQLKFSPVDGQQETWRSDACVRLGQILGRYWVRSREGKYFASWDPIEANEPGFVIFGSEGHLTANMAKSACAGDWIAATSTMRCD